MACGRRTMSGRERSSIKLDATGILSAGNPRLGGITKMGRAGALHHLINTNDLLEKPLAQAETIPADWVTHPDFEAWDTQTVFAQTWQWVGTTAQLQQPGETLQAIIGRMPVIVFQATDGSLKAFENVCRHRGGPLTVPQKHCDVLRCAYHGWTYNQAGKLIGTPEFDGVENFDAAQFFLREVRLSVWEGQVFVSLNSAVEPLEQLLAGIRERIVPLDLSAMRFATQATYDIACNWKVYVDNYLEGYHINAVHPELADMLDYRNYVTELDQVYSLQYSPIRPGQNMYGANANEDGQAFYYWVYPNLMLNIMPGRLQVNRVLPLAYNQTRVVFDYFYDAGMSDEAVSELMSKDLPYSEMVQQQDITICEAVQRGLASGSYTRGRFSVKRESGVHHFHNLLRAAYRQGLEALEQRSALADSDCVGV